jgi:hypothetical protein
MVEHDVDRRRRKRRVCRRHRVDVTERLQARQKLKLYRQVFDRSTTGS